MVGSYLACRPPPENPAIFYGLVPRARPAKLSPALNLPTFDKQAVYRFSLAFQCIVNIGVRGSELIRSRVVQAGMLDVVGCILEAWLANKGFTVCPSTGTVGVLKESTEQRHQRKLEQRQRDDALQLQRALQRQLHAEHPRRNRTYEELQHLCWIEKTGSGPIIKLLLMNHDVKIRDETP